MDKMILMHKNIPAAEIQIKDNKPFMITKVLNKEELPVGLYPDIVLTDSLKISLMSSWYDSRAIPECRPGLKKIEEKIGPLSETFLKTSGISLTDTFWIKKEDSPLNWEDVNFYDNGFESVLAKEYLGGDISFKPSPDFTTDGMLEKFWISSYGIPYLVKLDKRYNGLQVANEVVAARIASVLNIPHIKYDHVMIGDVHGCICPSFIHNSDEDFVSLLQIRHLYIGQNIDIKKIFPKKFLDDISDFDALIGNIDRHEKNVGFINKDPCPIFDSGSCLNFNKKGLNVDLKLPRLKRKDAVIGKYKVPDLTDILKEVYEEFEISKEDTKVAIESLKYGADILNEAANKKSFEEVIKEAEEKTKNIKIKPWDDENEIIRERRQIVEIGPDKHKKTDTEKKI